MKLKNLFFVASIILLFSCASEDEKMQKYLLGNWETSYVKLEFQSFRGKDTIVEYDIDYANPHDPRAKQQGIGKLVYKADGTFESWSEKNNLKIGRITKGKWNATKDSLFYEFDQGPDKPVYKVAFGLKMIEDGFAIKAKQDRDNDGVQDDTYYLETVRLPDSN